MAQDRFEFRRGGNRRPSKLAWVNKQHALFRRPSSALALRPDGPFRATRGPAEAGPRREIEVDDGLDLKIRRRAFLFAASAPRSPETFPRTGVSSRAVF